MKTAPKENTNARQNKPKPQSIWHASWVDSMAHTSTRITDSLSQSQPYDLSEDWVWMKVARAEDREPGRGKPATTESGSGD
jgi:hypothetical protein